MSELQHQAFERLDAIRVDIKQYLPQNFDEEKELEEARVVQQRY